MEGHLVGQDPYGIERHWEAIYHVRRWHGGPVLNSALSGVESAPWDIIAEALGVPIHKLLGEPYRDRVKVHANAWFRGIEEEASATGRMSIEIPQGPGLGTDLIAEALDERPLSAGPLLLRRMVAGVS